MSVSKWFYHEGVCDYNYCCGECDQCDICKNPELYDVFDFIDEEEVEQEIKNARKGEE